VWTVIGLHRKFLTNEKVYSNHFPGCIYVAVGILWLLHMSYLFKDGP